VSTDADIRRWLYLNCPKDFAWIIFSQITSMITDSTERPNSASSPNPTITSESISYIYSVVASNTRITALFETSDGKYYVIANTKGTEETTIESKLYQYNTIGEMIDRIPKPVRDLLQIKKRGQMKLKPAQLSDPAWPLQYVNQDVYRQHQLLDQQASQTLPIDSYVTLDLSWNFTITPETLSSWVPSSPSTPPIQILSLHTNFRISDLNWVSCQWADSLTRVNIVNCVSLTDHGIEHLVKNLSNLTELYLHGLPQVGIRILLKILPHTLRANGRG